MILKNDLSHKATKPLRAQPTMKLATHALTVQKGWKSGGNEGEDLVAVLVVGVWMSGGDVGEEEGGGHSPGIEMRWRLMAALTLPTAARSLREEGRCGWRE